jgi:hypothetical protein
MLNQTLKNRYKVTAVLGEGGLSQPARPRQPVRWLRFSLRSLAVILETPSTNGDNE